jgi:hypothetical protein
MTAFTNRFRLLLKGLVVPQINLDCNPHAGPRPSHPTNWKCCVFAIADDRFWLRPASLLIPASQRGSFAPDQEFLASSGYPVSGNTGSADKDARNVSFDGKSYGLLFHINRSDKKPFGDQCMMEVGIRRLVETARPL